MYAIKLFASLAGKDTDSEIKVKRIEADLKILKVQVCVPQGQISLPLLFTS